MHLRFPSPDHSRECTLRISAAGDQFYFVMARVCMPRCDIRPMHERAGPIDCKLVPETSRPSMRVCMRWPIPRREWSITALSRCGVAPRAARPARRHRRPRSAAPCRRTQANVERPAAAHLEARPEAGTEDRAHRRRVLLRDREVEQAGAAFGEARLVDRSHLQAAERGDRGVAREGQAELVASLELAEELVGAGLSVGDGRGLAGNGDDAL